MLRVSNNEAGIDEHSPVLAASANTLEMDYIKVDKILHDILGSSYTPHIVGLSSATVELKYLFMVYSDGQVTLLYTRSYLVP